jgi:hypothetical protein
VKAAALLALLTVCFYWKLTFTRQFTVFASPDLANQVLPWYEFQARAWHSGSLPLWDPYQWCGQSLAGQWQPGALFPLNWPLFWAPLKDGRLNLDLWHWHFVLLHLLAACCMYAYCRDLGRSRPASVIAGAGFSLGGYVGTTMWPQMMNGAVFTPLAFLLLRRPGLPNAALCGCTIGFALLAGHHQPILFVALAVAGICLTQRRLGRLAVIAVFAALVSAPALLPAFEYGSRAYRWLNLPAPLRGNETVPYIAHEPFGVIPLSLLGIVAPLDQGTTNPLTGIVAVSLALLGIATAFHDRNVKIHACLAVGGLAYALGAHSIFQGVLYAATPLLDKARSPGHAMLLFHFGVFVLAARGCDALRDPGSWTARILRGVASAGALGWLAALASPVPSDRSHAILLSSTVALLMAAAIHLRSPKAMLVLLVLELSAGTNYLFSPRHELDRPSDHLAVAGFLRSQPAPFRFHAADGEVPYNLGDREGLEATAGYLASVSADLYDFVALDWSRSALWLNQVYWIAREKTRPNQEEVFAAPGGLKVFRDPEAFPRAWLVTRSRSVRHRTGVGPIDPRHEAFFYGAPPALQPCDPQGRIDFTARGLHRIAARVVTSCRALAVFSDPAFPGWRARVDGRRVPIHRAFGALRSVIVEPGTHTVEFHYRPWSVYLGALLAVLGLGSAAVWSWLAGRSHRAV